MSLWVRSKKPAWSSGTGFVGRLEVEELDLRPRVEREALLAGAVQVALQHVARVALERLAREVLDVAEHPGDRGVVAAPRHDVEGVRVGHREHVGLLDPAVALDGRAVEGHALLERALELGGRDGEALERAEDVGEPEPDEPDAAFLDGAHDVVELLLHSDQCSGRFCRLHQRSGPRAVTRRSHRGKSDRHAARSQARE